MQFFAYRSETAPAEVRLSCFRGDSGVRECHLVAQPVEYAPVDRQLDWIAAAYRAALASHGLNAGTALFRRFFCSDLVNQAPALGASPLARRAAPDEPCAISWVHQPPAPPAKLALWAYHVGDPAAALDKRLDGHTLTWDRNGLAHQWTTGLSCPVAGTPAKQTRGVFQHYAALLRARDLSLARDVIRTWVFVKDIGAHYEAMAASRREFFAAQGLTPETHFIASTGIEGVGPDPHAAVTLEAYAIGGVRPEQIAHLQAPDHLCPTFTYGVTFERATQVAYRDRAHVVVSGTASIDPQGRILHAGDVSRQLDRTLQNIDALLRRAGAGLADLAILIAYVRDPADQATVREQLRERCGGTPVLVVVARICRPGWLVEIEGLAIRADTRPELPAF